MLRDSVAVAVVVVCTRPRAIESRLTETPRSCHLKVYKVDLPPFLPQFVTVSLLRKSFVEAKWVIVVCLWSADFFCEERKSGDP